MDSERGVFFARQRAAWQLRWALSLVFSVLLALPQDVLPASVAALRFLERRFPHTVPRGKPALVARFFHVAELRL